MIEIAQLVGEELLYRQLSIATAESCTGGLVSSLITEITGSSQWFDRGFVTYSNEAKQEMLGVSENTLLKHGAVSATTVSEMALGAIKYSRASCSIAISGVAGPTGGSPEKPVGTVFIAWKTPRADVTAERFLFSGDRASIRRQAAYFSLVMLYQRL